MPKKQTLEVLKILLKITSFKKITSRAWWTKTTILSKLRLQKWLNKTERRSRLKKTKSWSTRWYKSFKGRRMSRRRNLRYFCRIKGMIWTICWTRCRVMILRSFLRSRNWRTSRSWSISLWSTLGRCLPRRRLRSSGRRSFITNWVTNSGELTTRLKNHCMINQSCLGSGRMRP